MDALRKQIQCLVDYVLKHCFGQLQCQTNYGNDCNSYSGSPIWFALISTRGMKLDKLLLHRSSRFFALQVISGSMVSANSYF